MRNRIKNQTVEVKITEYSKKGNGLGVYDHPQGMQWKVEVPFTMPGDIVRATVLRKRSGIYTSKLEEILTPSVDRIPARCVHFGTCGGCRWQHLSYAEQLRNKESLVRHSFAKLLTHEVDFRPIYPSPEAWEYRNKMEFSFSTNAARDPFLGLMMDGGRGKVLNLTECHLVNPWFVAALQAVKSWWKESALDAYHAIKNTGSLRTLILREGQRTGDRMVMLTVSGNPDYALHKQQLETFVAYLRDAIEPVNPSSHLSIFLRIQQVAKGMATNFYEMLLYGPDHITEILHIKIDPNLPAHPLIFQVSPAAFFQPNTRQAEQLYSMALQMAEIPRQAVVYDLYCGTGTLGVCIAKHAKQVLGIELSPESALDARTNATLNGVDNMTVISGAVRHVLNQVRQENRFPPPDVVMVDPPRPGLDPEALKHLLELKAPKILYISCNPTTQAANIADLVAEGYRIRSIQPIDQFPHTLHVENVVVLVRD